MTVCRAEHHLQQREAGYNDSETTQGRLRGIVDEWRRFRGKAGDDRDDYRQEHLREDGMKETSGSGRGLKGVVRSRKTFRCHDGERAPTQPSQPRVPGVNRE